MKIPSLKKKYVHVFYFIFNEILVPQEQKAFHCRSRINVLSLLNGEMSSFYMKRRTRRKMPFIIIVLCRVII